MQLPDLHVSFSVQAVLSLHAVPSGSTGVEQTPVAGLHTPAPWQLSVGPGQTMGAPPVHDPATHTSLIVQALPSLHGVPSGFAGLVQPVTGSQVPALWHWSVGAHVTA